MFVFLYNFVKFIYFCLFLFKLFNLCLQLLNSHLFLVYLLRNLYKRQLFLFHFTLCFIFRLLKIIHKQFHSLNFLFKLNVLPLRFCLQFLELFFETFFNSFSSIDFLHIVRILLLLFPDLSHKQINFIQKLLLILLQTSILALVLLLDLEQFPFDFLIDTLNLLYIVFILLTFFVLRLDNAGQFLHLVLFLLQCLL